MNSAVRFAVSLHTHHGKSLSDAYLVAVTQFRSLRSEQRIATLAAAAEAEAYDAEFGPTETEKGFEREEEHLKTFEASGTTVQESVEARKRWKMIVGGTGNPGKWSLGEDYTRLWKEGVRPDYMSSLSAPAEQTQVPEGARLNFLQLQHSVQK